MARISYEEFQKRDAEQEYSGNGIGFFSLKDDGDEAIVRIMHNGCADYDILTTHQIQVGGKYTQVDCLGDGCPLCNAGVKIRNRFFIHMIQYVKDENGQIVAKPVVWDRAAKSMSEKLNAMLQEYGPLSDCIFKIRRNGKAQDKNTTYEIMFANPNVYRPDLYPKDDKVFEGYSVCGKQVMTKTADEMVAFLNTGSFPERTSTTADTATANEYHNAVAQQAYSTPVTPTSAPVGYAGATPTAQTGARPNRYY
jgi:hypothetical protein